MKWKYNIIVHDYTIIGHASGSCWRLKFGHTPRAICNFLNHVKNHFDNDRKSIDQIILKFECNVVIIFFNQQYLFKYYYFIKILKKLFWFTLFLLYLLSTPRNFFDIASLGISLLSLHAPLRKTVKESVNCHKNLRQKFPPHPYSFKFRQLYFPF